MKIKFITHSQRPASFSKGVTLLELVVAITIIAMLSGTVFAIVSGSLRAVAQTRQMQSENDQISHFFRLCRQAFQSLPATATITLKSPDGTTGAAQELTIAGAPEIFCFGPNPISYKDTVLGLRPNAEATAASDDKQTVYDLSLTRADIIPTDPGNNSALVRTGGAGPLAPDDQGRVWMPLLPNVASLTWRVYKNDDEQWVDEWSDTNLPLLIEMNLTPSGSTQPLRAVFTLPVLKLAGANSSLAPRKSTTPTQPTNIGAVNSPPANGNQAPGRFGRDGQGRGDRGGRPPGGGFFPRDGGRPGFPGGRPGGAGTPGSGPPAGTGGATGAGAKGGATR